MTTSTERGGEAASLIERLSIGSVSLSFENSLEAFRPTSTSQARASIILQLSQTKEDVVRNFSSKLAQLLSSEPANTADYFAAVRLLTSFFSVLPQAAHELVFDSHIISLILTKSALAADENYLPAFITAELLCAASNHANSRRWILADYEKSMKSTQKIVEISESSATEYTSMHWLLSFAEKANLENASSGSLLCKVAMLSSLALHKIQKGSRGKEADDQLNLANSQEEEEGEKEERRRQDDMLLFELAKAHLVLDEKSDAEIFSDTELLYSLDLSTREDLERVCRLSSVESLTYLTLDTFFRDAVADADQLLVKLCHYGKVSSGSEGDDGSKTLFPQRGPTASQTTSTYELDKVLTSTDSAKWLIQDTALQYGLATLLANVTAYPPLMTSEEKQMEKLKQMANAKAKVKGGNKTEEKSDTRMTTAAIERRIEKVIGAGGAEALATIALGGAKESRVNSSSAIRETVSKAMLSMTTRQDKLQRGKIIQQRGAKALLTLSSQQIADALQGRTKQTVISFAAMQGLAHLLISENPNLVLRDAAESIPCLLYLYCHSTSSRLQRFEAALALTNLGSLGEGMAQGIASCAFPRKILGTTDFAGAGSGEVNDAKVKIIDILDERIFLEDNEMSRRSSLELLCNLLVEDTIFKRWSGEEEDDDEGRRNDNITQGKTMKNLIFMVALCSPLGVDQSTNEGGLKLRMAASGALATLCSSPSTCERLLVAETRILNKVCRLLGVPESKGDEGTDAELHEQDISEDPLGPDHAMLQLALRGLTCLDCLIQYVTWLQSQGNNDVTVYKSKLVEAGCVEAIKGLALSMVKKIKQPQSSALLQSVKEQVAQQSFDSLRACKTLGLV